MYWEQSNQQKIPPRWNRKTKSEAWINQNKKTCIYKDREPTSVANNTITKSGQNKQ